MLALIVLNSAAVAEVTVSRSNDPDALVEDRLVALLGEEHVAFGQVQPTEINALADGVAASRAAADAASHDAAWLAALPEATGNEEWQCLTQALYFEARGETITGEFAVAEVILNRVDSPRYPATICGVVNQRGNGGCQFSYTCDGRSDRIAEPEAYALAGKIARLMLDGAPRDLTLGATHFVARSARPAWASQFAFTTTIGAHVFYRQPAEL